MLLGPVLGDVTWSIALYAVLSLTVVRLIPVGIALIGTGARRPTVAFLGWFGPRGLASIVFAVLVLEEGGLPHDDLILTTIYLAIGLSVLAHGLTAAPLANRYADWYESHPHDALPPLESSEAREVRWRFGVGHSRGRRQPSSPGPETASHRDSLVVMPRERHVRRECDRNGESDAGRTRRQLELLYERGCNVPEER